MVIFRTKHSHIRGIDKLQTREEIFGILLERLWGNESRFLSSFGRLKKIERKHKGKKRERTFERKMIAGHFISSRRRAHLGMIVTDSLLFFIIMQFFLFPCHLWVLFLWSKCRYLACLIFIDLWGKMVFLLLSYLLFFLIFSKSNLTLFRFCCETSENHILGSYLNLWSFPLALEAHWQPMEWGCV